MLLLSITIAGLSIGSYRILSATRSREFEPGRVSVAEGRTVPTLPRWAGPAHETDDTILPAATRLIYVVRSDCEFCERQRLQLAEALSALPREWVVTLAPESPDRLTNYWHGATTAPANPISVDIAAMKLLRVPGTPSLYFLDRDGVVRRAWVGMSLSWSKDRYRREIELADDAASQLP